VSDSKGMFSLLAVLGVFGVNAGLSARYGRDSRNTRDQRPNW
jgi:hypothetical protein